MNADLVAFVRDSNLIEGITRDPTPDEVGASDDFLRWPTLTVPELRALQAIFAPGMPLRDRAGLDVRVGSYIAPAGGPNIVRRLEAILERANAGDDPWSVHVQYEMLHPFCDGNGRTGRMIWAWQMIRKGRDPFALPFLHRFYYQTLDAQR